VHSSTGVDIPRTSVAAGPKLRPPGWEEAGEEFAVGGVRLHRDEWDANGVVAAKGVEAVFVRSGNARGPDANEWRTGPRVTGEG
jgi:hypothetical protein